MTMDSYIADIIETFSQFDPNGKTVATPAADNLFEVKEEVDDLGREQQVVFHKFTAKCLFLTK